MAHGKKCIRTLKRARRFLAASLAALFVLELAGGIAPIEVQAANKVLTLKMAKAQAVINSDAYYKIESKLGTKQVSLTQATRSIAEKRRSMSTFRWSPLLNFKFPEKPDLSDESDFTLKPIKIQAEIDTLKHQLTDQKLAEYEAVSTLYVDIITSEKNIAFNRQRLDSMNRTLDKNRARLKLGLAKQGDIDKMEKDAAAIESKLASDTRTLENAKKKMSSKIGIDVSTGYTFQNAFLEADLSRSILAELKKYTLDRDQNYYSTCMDAQTALTTLKTNYSLMSSQYGGKMSYISGYVRQAESGEKLNEKAFKSDYENFLKAIDDPWQGSKKILFIRIPKEWFKGEIDGIRYVEDEPYALFEAAKEYQDARIEKENTAKDLEQQVEDTYNNYVNERNAYLNAEKEVEKAKNDLLKDEKLNIIGELTYEEYKTSQDTYESAQQAAVDALSMYSKSLYQFDRLTCGGVSAFLEGTGIGLEAARAGQSYVETEYASGGAYYSIQMIVQNQEFTLGVFLPEDFDVEVTDFELWCDGVQIGERTKIDKTIRHLALAKENVSEAKIRFYNGDEFVDDCVIDPSVLSGPLDIVKEYKVVTNDDPDLGSYSFSTNASSGLTTLTFKLRGGTDIASYSIKTSDGKKLLQDDPIPADKEFRYLSVLESSAGDLTIEFYDKDGKALFEAYFDTVNSKVMKKVKAGD